MSATERNLQLLRDGLDAFSRGALDESLAQMHPEVEWHVVFPLPDRPSSKDVYRGREEVRELWEEFRSVWDELTIELEEVLHVDSERVLARTRFHGRGAGSGAEVDRMVFYVFRIRDGLLEYTRAFDDEASARRELGLTDVT
jgi:ketosteroid isomerase-like protein